MASRHLGLDHMGYTCADGTGETLSFLLVISFPHTPHLLPSLGCCAKWVKKYELQGKKFPLQDDSSSDETQKKKFDFVALFLPLLFCSSPIWVAPMWSDLGLGWWVWEVTASCQEENSLTTPVNKSSEQSTGTRYIKYISTQTVWLLTQMFPVV